MACPRRRPRLGSWGVVGILWALGLAQASPAVVYAPAPMAPAAAASVATTHGQPAAQSGRKKKARQRATTLDPFVGTLEAARKASLEQNVPLLVHLILEGEPENDAYRNAILPDQDLIAASEFSIVLIANNGEHELKKVKEEIEGVQVESLVCSVYPVFANCAQHREPWDSIYAAYHDEAGDLQCPQTIIVLPDGKEAWRRNDGNPPKVKDVTTWLGRAQEVAGPGLTRRELGEVKRLVKEAERSTDGKLWGQAWRDWEALLEIIEVGAFAQEARAAQTELKAQMRAQLAELALGLVPGSAAGAYAELDALLGEWVATPLEAELKKTLRSAEKDKAIAEEIRAWLLEREASALLQEALDCFTAEDEKCARKALRKLLGKKYATTQAAARALAEFPEYAPAEKG
jgi:hypothetical protein